MAAGLERKNCKIARKINETKSDDFIHFVKSYTYQSVVSHPKKNVSVSEN